MIFQAYRTIYACSGSHSARVQNNFIVNHRFFRVSCAPCRSSFSAAFEDVKKARKLGFVAAVRPLVSTNQF